MSAARARSILALVVLGAAFAVAGPLRADTIYPAGAPPISGVTVTAESIVAVEYSLGAGRRASIESWRVLLVRYDREPKAFRAGYEAFVRRDYEAAAARLEALLAGKEAAQLPFVREHAIFLLARARFALGQDAACAALCLELETARPDARFAGESALLAARALRRSKAHAEAQARLVRLDTLAERTRAGGLWAQRAAIALGELRADEQKDVEAVRVWSTVLGHLLVAAPDDPLGAALVVDVRLALARHAARRKDLERCRELRAELEGDGGPAAAWAAAAARIVRAEEALQGGGDVTAAMIDLARVRVEQSAVVSARAPACYLLGRLHLERGAKDLARRYFEEVRTRHAESAEAAPARLELERL
jgi:TolA-binding protein